MTEAANEVARSYYAVIPAEVRYDRDLTANAKLLYGEITALCNDRGYCWAENGYFSELYGVSKVSVSKWIKALTDKGYITIETGKGNDRYIMLSPPKKDNEVLKKSLRPHKEKFKTSLTKVNDPLKKSLRPLKEKFKTQNITSNTTVNINTPYNPPKGILGMQIEKYTECRELREALSSFCAMRKEIKKPLSERAFSMVLKKLDDLGDTDKRKTDIVNQSILHCWQSVYPIKEDVRQSNVFADNEYDYDEIERLMNKMQNAECKMQN